VIAGNHEQVARIQHRQERRQRGVECLERSRESRHVAAVPVQHVEVDEIAEQETGRTCAHAVAQNTQAVRIVFRVTAHVDPALREDTADLADAGRAHVALAQAVEHGRRRRRLGEVVAVGGARKRLSSGRIADERARDHPADAQFIAQGSRRATDRVEPLEPERLLVRGDLPDAVGARVENRLAAAHVLRAERGDDLGPAGRAIPEHPRQVVLRRPTRDDLRRKTLRKRGERRGQDDARHLPMPRGRVLARGALRGASERADRLARRAAADPGDWAEVSQPEPLERGQPQSDAAAVQNGGSEVTERIGSGVTVLGRIGQRADADAVEDDPYDA
jgi:hypothetical protein